MFGMDCYGGGLLKIIIYDMDNNDMIGMIDERERGVSMPSIGVLYIILMKYIDNTRNGGGLLSIEIRMSMK